LNAQTGWVAQTNPLADSALGKIQFVSSTEGWISEAHGRLLHTTNAGTNWTVITPFPADTVTSMTDPANSMSWADQKHGWKINWLGTSFGDTHGAVIHKTTDGGNTWTKKVLSTVIGEMGFQIQFVDTNNGWASVYNYSSGNMVTLRSTNGGNTWDTVATSGIFYFVDASNGWSIGGTKIYHTTNGGSNWSLQYTSAGTGGFNTIQFTDLNHGWVVGDSSKILKTINGGTTWTSVTNTGISSNFRSKGLFFLDANHGWIGSKIVNMPLSGDVGINLYTTNGGSTWITQTFSGANNSDNVWSIFFWDVNNGWYTSDDGIIGHTAAGGTASSQTASDYYTPLRVGNYLKFHTTGVVGSIWAARTTTYSIEGSDMILGRQYVREKGSELLDESGESDVFRVFWLRKDSVGNVAMGAMSTTESSNIDSATVVIGAYLFPNGFLTKGYSLRVPWGNVTLVDSVLSVTETVSVPAGTFTNCLEIAEFQIDSTGAVVFYEYHYYAAGIGMVENIRTIPINKVHTDVLTEYNVTAVTKVSGNAVGQTPRSFSLSQNYPNPFNPSTMITFSVGTYGYTSLKVFDVLGREVATLVNEVKSAGTYTATFNANHIPSGVYFYRLQSGSFSETKKLLLLK
jgi:photosystem II stability/assembly factor-like uncharacterized protein